MRPVLLKLFGIKIYGYGTMIAIGIIAALLLLSYRCKKKGYDEDSIFNMAIIAIICGVIGGKVLYIITDIKAIMADPSLLKDIGSGFVVYGSILGGALGAYGYCLKKKWSVLKIFDLAVPSLPLAQGFGRIGCFLAGCCYGKATDLAWGVHFKEGSLGPIEGSVHPTQIYSSIFDFALAVFLLWLDRKQKKDGRLFSLYLIIYSIGRFFVEFIRDDPRGSVGVLSTSQFISLLIVVVGLVLYNLENIKSMFSKTNTEDGI